MQQASRNVATRLARETAEIPQRVAAQIDMQAPRYREIGAALNAMRPVAAATLARGSSDHAATFLKYLCEMRVGIPVASLGPSLASVYGCRLRLSNMVSFALSQSGRSPDLVAFQRMAGEQGARTIALVNTVVSPLAEVSLDVADVGAGVEEAVAASKSFVCTLSAAAAIVDGWAGDSGLAAALADLPECLHRALACDWSRLLPVAAQASSVYVIARGPGLAVAQEAALKLKETCELHAESFSAAEMMHGPIQLAAGDLCALVFLTRDAARPGLVSAVERLAATGTRVFVADPLGEVGGSAGVAALPCIAAPAPLLDPLCQITSFYRFVDHLARGRGLDPDRPRLLKKVTETI